MALSAQTRPEPMNSSPHHSKVKVSLMLPHPIHIAGQDIPGKMEVECRADKGLGISVMMVELFAYQELTSRDHSATSTFLHSRRLFQGPGLPPSNAVQSHPQPGDIPLPQGYYQARRGISTFLFRIPLPSSAPSTISFGSDLARVRYEVRATVGILWKGEKRLVTCKKEIDVVESYEIDYSRIEPEGVVVGEFGKIWVQGKVVGGIVVAGESACVELHVKNHSSKKNNSLTLILSRTLVLPGLKPGEVSPLQISDVLTSVPFRGPEYVIQPGVEGIASLVFDVPNHARGVKGGTLEGNESEGRTTESLFEIRCIIGITLNMGIGTKDIQLNIPVPIVHPAALPEPTEYTSPPYNEAYSTPIPYPYHPPLISSPTPTAYIDPLHRHVWLPPPQSYTPHPDYISPPAGDAEQYYFPPPPHVPILAHLPPRPLSAGTVPNDAFSSRLPLDTDVRPAPPSASQYLVPISDLNVEPVEGKGERAARVTQHLRLSSRHRSVSPQSHRFPLSSPPAGSALQAFSTPASSQESRTDRSAYTRNLPPPPPPVTSSTPSKKVGLSATNTVVHSPRPVLSPKHSFDGSVPKSDRVEQLERMADQVAQATKDLSADLPKLVETHNVEPTTPLADIVPESNINKTLPIPPPPTRKAKEKAVPDFGGKVLHIDKLFDDMLNPEENFSSTRATKTPQAPRTPLAAVTPVKLPFKPKSHESHAQLHPSGNAESGLDVLERRLLAEVGTRKLDPGNERPPVWDIVGAQPIDIPVKTVTPDPLNDSAISSLTLAGEREAVARGDAEVDVGLLEIDGDHDSDEKTHRAGKSSISGDSRGGRTERGRKKAKKEKKDKRGSSGKEPTSSRAKKSAAAKGRVAAWLGGIDPEVPPVEEVLPPSSVVVQKAPSSSSQIVEPSRAEDEVKASALDTLTRSKDDEVQPIAKEEDVSANPNPRSSGFVPVGTFKHDASSRQFRQLDGKATIMKEARRVEEIWSSAPIGKISNEGDSSAPTKDTPPLLALITPARTIQSVRTDRNVSPPSTAGAGDVLGAKYHNANAMKPPVKSHAPMPSLKQADTKQSLHASALRPLIDPEVKYDVRSARGGRGGRVTAITAIWATGGPDPGATATKNNFKPALKAVRTLAPQAIASAPAPSTDPVDMKLNSQKLAKPLIAANTSSLAPASTEPKVVERAAARRTPLVKSSSVPAVLSSSHATPMLSSTASLARPPTNQVRLTPTKIPPTISEASSGHKPHNMNVLNPMKSASTNHVRETAFGQARLRELIKKYQGQTT